MKLLEMLKAMIAEVGGSLSDIERQVVSSFEKEYSAETSWDTEGGPTYYVRDVFKDHGSLGDVVVIENRFKNTLSAVSYVTADDGAITFAAIDQWRPVVLSYESSENEPAPEPEPAPETTGEAFAESLTGSIELAEADPPASPRDPLAIKMRLIKAGPGNPSDNHYYPGDVLRRDAHVFEGVKMYTTPHIESERSEENEVAKIRQIIAFEDDGSPIADVLIFDPAFAEKTRNRAKEGELNSLECSILAQGVAKEGDIDGETYNVVESIESAQAVDFVPKAGAGGKALSIAESEAGAGASETPETPKAPEVEPDPPKPLLEKEQVLSVLRETNLPGPSQERLAGGEYNDDAALTEAITNETAYVKSVSGSGQPLGSGATEPATPKVKTAEERIREDAEWYEKQRTGHGLSPR